MVLIGGVLGANLLPSLLYTREHGKNTEVAHRQAAEVDIYGLRVIQLLTPIPDHRLEPLARLSNDLQQTPYNSEQSMFLGLVGSIGLLGMIGALLVRVARPGAAPTDDGDDDDDDGGRGRLPRRGDDVRPLFGVLTIVIILVATMGGLAWFLAVAGFTELRGWNRISIVVAFLALAWLALSIDRLLAHRSYGVRGRALLALAGVVVIVFGIADQTSKQIVPDRRTYQAEFHADRAYFGAIEDRLPRGAAVFQLPYIPFPEAGPVNNIVEYDPLRPYLNTKHLRWSYGGMKGRDSDWQAVAATEPAAQVVQDAIATGFSGVLVDRNGYQDKAESLTAELAQLTGDPGFASADDRFVFFDLAVPTAQYNQSTTPAQRAARAARRSSPRAPEAGAQPRACRAKPRRDDTRAKSACPPPWCSRADADTFAFGNAARSAATPRSTSDSRVDKSTRTSGRTPLIRSTSAGDRFGIPRMAFASHPYWAAVTLSDWGQRAGPHNKSGTPDSEGGGTMSLRSLAARY